MSEDSPASVVESVREWTESRSDRGHSGSETALVVSCSMCDDGHRGPLWPVDATWNRVGVRTLGGQTRERYEGDAVLDGTIEHLTARHDIAAVLVVGHTRCAVLEDAYERWVETDRESPPGLELRLDPLRSLVGDGFEEGVLSESMSPRTVRYRLVEYNVRRQVRSLQRALPSSVTVAGYVHDQDGAYSPFPDRRYLVALDGASDPRAIRTRLPDGTPTRVASLLS